MLLIFNSLSWFIKPPSTLFPNSTISFLPFPIGIFYRSESSDSWFCSKYNSETVGAWALSVCFHSEMKFLFVLGKLFVDLAFWNRNVYFFAVFTLLECKPPWDSANGTLQMKFTTIAVSTQKKATISHNWVAGLQLPVHYYSVWKFSFWAQTPSAYVKLKNFGWLVDWSWPSYLFLLEKQVLKYRICKNTNQHLFSNYDVFFKTSFD